MWLSKQLYRLLLQCRFIIYKKNIERQIAIESPMTLGGLKSEAYLALNPLGLMPLLVLPDGTCLPESEVSGRHVSYVVNPGDNHSDASRY